MYSSCPWETESNSEKRLSVWAAARFERSSLSSADPKHRVDKKGIEQHKKPEIRMTLVDAIIIHKRRNLPSKTAIAIPVAWCNQTITHPPSPSVLFNASPLPGISERLGKCDILEFSARRRSVVICIFFLNMLLVPVSESLSHKNTCKTHTNIRYKIPKTVL